MRQKRDTFIQDGTPPKAQQPDFMRTEKFKYPDDFNIAVALLDDKIVQGAGEKTLFITKNDTWSYGRLYKTANQIANWLSDDTDFMVGDRVLLRSGNTPMLVACWFGVVKAGGIVVTTMPMLRTKDIDMIATDCDCRYALCDYRYKDEIQNIWHIPADRITLFDADDGTCDTPELNALNTAIKTHSTIFETVILGRDDIMLLGPTSGTTGRPKITMHTHADCMSICRAFPETCMQVNENDIFIGSPPIGFTFGLGALVLFPMYYNASAVLLEKAPPDAMLWAIEKYKATICFTAPTAWRALAIMAPDYDTRSLTQGISAGEALSPQVYKMVQDSFGISLLDGIGATEMLHIFVGRRNDTPNNGSLGTVVDGYEACLIDDNADPVAVGHVGWLAVRGVTGCRYLHNPTAQKKYVVNGWNKTGDKFYQDTDGYFYCAGRGDDIIVTSGYNVSPLEVEFLLRDHPHIHQVVVAGTPDKIRGQVITAFVVLKPNVKPDNSTIQHIQDWFKVTATPYKYPRKIIFLETIPRTPTGKIQRHKLQDLL